MDTERSAPTDAGAPHGLWAITSFFNPLGFKRRRANYVQFRQGLRLPLIAIELGFGRDFELGAGDAEILIQLRGGDILWQKERLLNLALARLPADCNAVAWLDCDVLFERHDWANAAIGALERYPLLQPFGEKQNLPREWTAGEVMPMASRILYPPAKLVAEGVSARDCLGDAPEADICGPGLAWVARRELLSMIGFYDACVVGGGDHAFAAAVFGCMRQAIDRQMMNERRRAHYENWANAAKNIAGEVGYIDGRIFHLWHGEAADRGYVRRHQEFAAFGMDPFKDIALTDVGTWRWNSPKPEMHAYVRDYLASRREDG